MKTTKLVIGILSIILSLLVTFQSCAAGLANTVKENGEVSGTAGVVLAVCFLVAGIVAIATRKNIKSKGGYVAASFYILGGLLGLTNAGSYKDLAIWGVLAIIFGVVFIAGDMQAKKKAKEELRKRASKKKKRKRKRKPE